MPKFEKYLNVSKDPEWANFYVAYGDLKAVLKDSVEKQHFAATLRASRVGSAGDGWGLHGTQNSLEGWNMDISTQSTSAASVDEAFSKVRVRANVGQPPRFPREMRKDDSTPHATHNNLTPSSPVVNPPPPPQHTHTVTGQGSRKGGHFLPQGPGRHCGQAAAPASPHACPGPRRAHARVRARRGGRHGAPPGTTGRQYRHDRVLRRHHPQVARGHHAHYAAAAAAAHAPPPHVGHAQRLAGGVPRHLPPVEPLASFHRVERRGGAQDPQEARPTLAGRRQDHGLLPDHAGLPQPGEPPPPALLPQRRLCHHLQSQGGHRGDAGELPDAARQLRRARPGQAGHRGHDGGL